MKLETQKKIAATIVVASGSFLAGYAIERAETFRETQLRDVRIVKTVEASNK